MSLFRDRGVVLRTYRLGEADKIIVFLTERHGKVRAVAKGVRRTNSKFGARLEPLTHVDLLLWQGRSDLDIVNQVEVLDSFRPVREDLGRMPRGMALLEVSDQMAQERHPDPRLYSMLVGALAALCRPALRSRAARPVVLPQGTRPRRCRPRARGVRRRAASPTASWSWWPSTWWPAARCAGRTAAGVTMSPDALVLLRRILGGELAAVLSGPPPPGADEVAELATEAMEAHLDRRIRSVRSTATL